MSAIFSTISARSHRWREKPYDFIILDPPAFTKSRKTVGNAANGYREIDSLAMRILPRRIFCNLLLLHSVGRPVPANAAECALKTGIKLRQSKPRRGA